MNSYVDNLIPAIIQTKWSKTYITKGVMILLTTLFRIHVDALLGFLFYTNYWYVNSCVHVMTTTLLVLKSEYVYNFIDVYEKHVYQMVRYFINNYSYDNYHRWKRYLNVIICGYIFIYSQVVTINNETIRILLFEYISSFIIIDFIENRVYTRIFHQFRLMENSGPKINCLTNQFEFRDDMVTECQM